MNTAARNLIENRFIAPTRKERTSYIGIEVEMPVVRLDGQPTDKRVSIDAFSAAVKRFDFTPEKFDVDGVCHEAVCEETGDVFSFDCSYNNFEISLGKVRTLHEAQARFQDYVGFINGVLRERGYLLTGMGINPNYKVNSPNFVPSPRYKMLEGYLLKSRVWEPRESFHSYCAYPTFSSASQVQLDVREENLCRTIEAFSLVEPLKALLFANSVLPDEPELLCARDMLWGRSTHGINPKNLGFFEPLPQSAGEVVDYLAGASIFCAERDGHYLYFYPVPFAEYLKTETIEGEYFDGGRYVSCRFAPRESDIEYLRTYKQVDLTARGTLEFRSACTQPLSQAMTVAAFHLGLMNRVGELTELLKTDTVIYGHGVSAPELRAQFNRRELPGFVDTGRLKELLVSVLDLARDGLRERGFAEEGYLEPLYARAEALTSPAKEMLARLDGGADIASVVEEYAELQVSVC